MDEHSEEDCKGSSASPIMSKNVWSNMYYCVNILLTKNALEHVHLEDKFVQNQLHIAGRLTGFPSHTFP